MRASADFAVLLYIFLLKCASDFADKIGITLGVVFFADRISHLFHHLRNQGPISCSEQIFICTVIGSQPIGVVRSDSVLANEIRVRLRNEAHEFLHCIPVPFDDRSVAVLHPRGPGNDDAGISPARRPFAAIGAKRIRRDIGEVPGIGLAVGHIVHEFVGESVNVEVVTSSAPEHAG